MNRRKSHGTNLFMLIMVSSIMIKMEKPLSDSQTINGVTYSFYEDGQARRGTFGPYGSGPFYDKVTGAAVREKGFHQVGPQWYYTDENGNKIFRSSKNRW